MISKIFKINLKMKNYILLFVSLLAMCHALNAQDYRRFSENTEAQTTIIRSYPMIPSSVVCYSKDASSGYIELRVEDGLTGRVPVPLEYEVKDMRLFDNLLYFCGRHVFNNGSCGFIAVTNINLIERMFNPQGTFLNNDVIIYTDVTINNYKNSIVSLDKLVVYSKPGSFALPPHDFANEHIVAIGHNYYNSILPNKFAVHIKYNDMYVNSIIAPISIPSVQVEMLYNQNHLGNETLEDVMVTDDYVSFIYSSGDDYVIYRKRKTLSLLNIFDSAYVYPAPQYEILSMVNGVAMDGNRIELASLAVNDINASTFEIRMRNIDLPTMAMTNSQTLFLGYQKQDMYMIYDTSSQKIVSLMYYDMISGGLVHTFIELMPLSSSAYNADLIYDQDMYASFDPTNMSSYVAATASKWYRKMLPMNNNQPSGCFERDSLPVGIITNLGYVVKEWDTRYLEDKLKQDWVEVEVELVENYEDCMSE